MPNTKIVNRIPTVEEYNFLRSEAGLTTKDPGAAAISLKNSLCSICVYSDEELVAMGRVIGDNGVYFVVVDLAVLPKAQGRGLGKAIMKELMDYIHKHAKKGSFISLFSNKGLAKFYKQFGFEERDPKSPGMSFLI